MAAPKRRDALLVLAVVILACYAGLGYGLLRLWEARSALEQELKSLETKAVLLQKRYKEQASLVAGMQQAKASLEGQLRLALTQKESLEKENQVLQVKEKERSQRIMVCDAKLNRVSDEYAVLKQEHEDLRKKHQEASAQMEKLEGDNRTLDLKLQRETQRFTRCRKHNGKLASMARELTEKYRNKGLMATLGEREPFTQIEKVKMENLLEEYQDKIDDETLEQEKHE